MDENERIKTDPTLRAVLSVSRVWGVSPSVILGRRPETVTTHHYDETGRLARSVAVSEPEWTHEDVQLALAFQGWESALCGTCRHPMEETTNVANERAYYAKDPIRCHRCTAAEVEMSRIENEKYPHPSALMLDIDLRGS